MVLTGRHPLPSGSSTVPPRKRRWSDPTGIPIRPLGARCEQGDLSRQCKAFYESPMVSSAKLRDKRAIQKKRKTYLANVVGFVYRSHRRWSQLAAGEEQ